MQSALEYKILNEKYHHIIELIHQGAEKKLPILPVGNWLKELEKYEKQSSSDMEKTIAVMKSEIEEVLHNLGYIEAKQEGIYINFK